MYLEANMYKDSEGIYGVNFIYHSKSKGIDVEEFHEARSLKQVKDLAIKKGKEQGATKIYIWDIEETKVVEKIEF